MPEAFRDNLPLGKILYLVYYYETLYFREKMTRADLVRDELVAPLIIRLHLPYILPYKPRFFGHLFY